MGEVSESCVSGIVVVFVRHFIHPEKKISFLYFDTCIQLAAATPDSLFKYYHRYMNLIQKNTDFPKHMILV